MSKISLKHSGGNVVSLNSPTNAPSAADVAFKLPNADGTSGQAIVTDASGNLSFAGTGKIVQVVSETKTNTASTNSTSFVTTGLEKAITITSGNKVLIFINLYVGQGAGYAVSFKLYNGSSEVTAFRGDDNGGSIRAFAGDFVTPYSYGRSEERRVGKECRSRWSPYH